jgi:hypothetical protein
MTNQPKKATTRHKPAISNNKTSPIYFLSLQIENVLCFKERQELNLSDKRGCPAQWTVIVGNNGVGKKTLLRCLAGMEVQLDWIDEEDQFFASPILFDLFFEYPSTWHEANKLLSDEAIIQAELLSGNSLSTIKKDEDLDLQKHEIAIQAGNLCSGGEELKGLICYGYGATRRMGRASLSDSYTPSEHSASLFSDDVLLINAEEWLLQNDYAIKYTSGTIRNRIKKQFTNIIEILKRILPDIKDIRISPDKERDIPVAEFLTPYGWVQFSSLGLGYRTTISWMVDLAVRLFKRYPDSEDPLAEPAIVLVDEIDLHMHPPIVR